MRLTPVALAVVLTAGCTGANTAKPPPISVTPAAAAPAQLGTAITVGDARSSTKATAYAYRQPLASAIPPQRRGYVHAGIDARVCVLQVTGANRLPVSWAPWSLEFADDTVANPIGGWSEEAFRVPLFPGAERRVRRGRCVRGWIIFEVPKGERPVRVAYAPGDARNAPDPVDWSIG